jgi:hypothetical protein
MKRTKIKAAELMAQLNADPDYVARKKAQDEEFQRREKEYARAQAPLVQELRAAGVHVSSVWDLVNTKDAYPQLLPILVHHLQFAYPDAIREGIARALAVPEAKFAWPLLLGLYRRETEKRTKSGLAVALANIADDQVIEELIALAKDSQHGVTRVLLLDALRRSRLAAAREALVEFEADPILGKEAKRILRMRKRTQG